MTDPSRRAVLAGFGATIAGSLAGCTVFSDEDDSPPLIAPTSIGRVLSESAPDVERPAPVQPSATAIEAGLDRCDELLASVPASVSPDEVPNGVVREDIETTRERALERRESVSTAPDRFRALTTLRNARRSAREAATAFEAVEDDLVDDVETERNTLHTTVGTRVTQIEYEGEDIERTLLLAVRLEDALTSARRRVQRGLRTTDPGVLDVGDLAGDVEFAAATLDAVDALVDQHVERTEDSIAFGDAFERALDTSVRSLSRADVPDQETTPEQLVGDRAARRDVNALITEALRSVTGQRDDIVTEFEEGRLASGLDRAFVLERDLRALDAVVERVVDGEFPELDGPERLRSERDAAIAAIESVPVSTSEQSLAGDVFARTLERLHWIDDEVQRHVDRDRDVDLTWEYAQYAHVRARLEAVPDVAETLRTRLEIA